LLQQSIPQNRDQEVEKNSVPLALVSGAVCGEIARTHVELTGAKMDHARRRSTARFHQSRRGVCADVQSIAARSHDAVVRVYDDAGNVIETHEHTGDFKEW
jgi:hypothetical protein